MTEVFAILGIHPHEAAEDHDLDALRDLLDAPTRGRGR